MGNPPYSWRIRASTGEGVSAFKYSIFLIFKGPNAVGVGRWTGVKL